MSDLTFLTPESCKNGSASKVSFQENQKINAVATTTTTITQNVSDSNDKNSYKNSSNNSNNNSNTNNSAFKTPKVSEASKNNNIQCISAGNDNDRLISVKPEEQFYVKKPNISDVLKKVTIKDETKYFFVYIYLFLKK